MAAPPDQPLATVSHWLRQVARYRASPRVSLALPAALVLVTLQLADLLRGVFPGSGLFLLLLLPVLLAALALGAWSGLVTLVFGVAGAWLMVLIRGHPWLSEPTDALRAIPYLFLGGFFVLVASVLREAVASRSMPIPARGTRLIEPLTPREVEVLGLAGSGLSTDRIAEVLCLSRNTVKSHLLHAYAKLGAHNRAEAVAAGLHSGWVPADVITSRAPEITGPVSLAPRREDRQPASIAAE